MFDEPSSYLDVKQRLKAAHAIRTLISPEEEKRRIRRRRLRSSQKEEKHRTSMEDEDAGEDDGE